MTTTPATFTLTALRTHVAEITASYNAAANKLRVADAATDETLAVFNGGGAYKLAPTLPAGKVHIYDNTALPNITERLAAHGVIEIESSFYDDISAQLVTTARVLI